MQPIPNDQDDVAAVSPSERGSPDAQIAAGAAKGREGTPMRAASVTLTVAGRKLQLRFDVPAAPMHPIGLLPLLQKLTDTLVSIAAEDAFAGGLSISCRKGCGACCRQLVPISELEAESIRRLVAELPEPRRSTVIEHFERGVGQLAEANMIDTLRAPERVDAERAESVGLDYFRQAIPCPFLEDESCSIYPDRPLACREYLVTTPASNCTNPTSENVQCVPVPAKVSRAARRIEDDSPKDFEPWIAMILALHCPTRPERQSRTGTSMVAKAFKELTGAQVPDA